MDDVDKKILVRLQQDGRITNLELSRLIHLSPAATLERVRKLEQTGIIRGYMAKLTQTPFNWVCSCLCK